MTTVPKDFKDYDDDDPNINFRKNRYVFWNILKKLRIEFMEEHAEFHTEDFIEWINEKFGIKVEMNPTGITDTYSITDEKKYTFFIIKYGYN
jgi:hypothetical protein